MLSINTNLSSLITQRSMNSATSLLNQAVERMSTGYKVNHAKDNAAAYSIITNMDTKIGAYQVAEDNTAMGMDMVTTASDTLGEMQSHAERLRALATQAKNGTYGDKSLNAIQSEAEALAKEVERLYRTAEYNGVKLFDVVEKKTTEINGPTLNSNGFIKNIDRIDTSGMTRLSSITDRSVALTDGEYAICDLDDLLALVELANNNKLSTGDTFIMGADIDVGEYCDEQIANNLGGWTPIGTSDKRFYGSFDGNGYTISNLKIDRATSDYQGLFGITFSKTIKNLKLENVDIIGQNYVGAIIGYNYPTVNLSLENCSVEGSIQGVEKLGGLVGQITKSIVDSCHSNLIVNGDTRSGGLIGDAVGNSTITNSFSEGEVYGLGGNNIGGLLGGVSSSKVDNCYSTANVIAENSSNVGGLSGGISYSQATNCYSTGKVVGNKNVGGLVGDSFSNYSTPDSICLLKNCYTTSEVSGSSYVGGLAGAYFGELENCTFKGFFKGSGAQSGGLVGNANIQLTMKDCSFEGDGEGIQGLFIGYIGNSTTTISDCQIVTCVEDTKALFAGEVRSTLRISDCLYNSYYEEKGLSLVKTATASAVIDYQNNKATDFVNNLNMQVGVNNSDSSAMNLTTSFLILDFSKFKNVLENDNGEYFATIDEFLEMTSKKQVEFGAMQNRLESALDEISTQYENLVSSRSTLRDADIAETSSEYIKQQILQQASATLMATANQTPALALQLI